MDHCARTFATRAHGAQTCGDLRCVFHLDAVATLATPYGDDAITVAYPHDTVEDTPDTLAHIEVSADAFDAVAPDTDPERR